MAGMALVVQEKQELDGTLHVGLGHVSGLNTNQITHLTIIASYVNNKMRFTLEYNTSSGRNLETLNMTCPFYDESRSYDEGDIEYAEVNSSDGMVRIAGRFKHHVEDADDFEALDMYLDPMDKPLYVFCKAMSNWDGTEETHKSAMFYVRGMNNNKGQMVNLNISNNWFYEEDDNHNPTFRVEYPSMESRAYYPADGTQSICVVGASRTIPRKNYSLYMVPYDMPGYYHNKDAFTKSLRVDSTNESTYPWFDGNLPYMVTDVTLSHGDGTAF